MADVRARRFRDMFLFPRQSAQRKLPSGFAVEGARGLTAENGLIPEDRQPTLQRIGRDLFRRVISNGHTFTRELNAQRHQRPDDRARLWFVLRNPEQDAQPWELLCNPNGGPYDFLACDPYTPLVRTLKMPDKRGALPPIDGPLRVLAIVAQPIGRQPLGITHEKKALRDALADAVRMKLVEVQWIEHRNTSAQLKKALKKPWHIVHFIGHGDFDEKLGIGMLAFEDATGQTFEMRAEIFANLFVRTGTRLVVLNSCRGAFAGKGGLLTSTAARVATRVPAVVSMQTAISDVAAVEFAREFYGCLLQGVAVESAVTAARLAVAAGGSAAGAIEWPAPVVYLSTTYDVLQLKTLRAPLDVPPRRSRSTLRKKKAAKRHRKITADVPANADNRPAPEDDPQKNQWGRDSHANGRSVSATVKALDRHWFEIKLRVLGDRGAPRLSEPVTFHLHDSFSEPVRTVEPKRGVAELRLVAYGAFTVGIEADKGETRLELDLSDVKGAPRAFRES